MNPKSNELVGKGTGLMGRHVKRMKQKAFAASVNRDIIMECEKIGIPLPEFAEISLDAMKEIGEEIGL